jgi:hypothetical protein
MFAYPDSATGFRNVHMEQFGQARPRLFNYSKDSSEIILGIKLYLTLLLKTKRFDSMNILRDTLTSNTETRVSSRKVSITAIQF